MAQKYAKDQPAGFTNRIERVAIVGAGGSIGKPVAEELLKKGKFTITALTRASDGMKVPEGVKVVPVDYNDEAALVAALTGQQLLVITLSVQAPQELQVNIVQAAIKAGVTWIMLNTWGGDVTDEKFRNETGMRNVHVPALEAIEASSTSSWISSVCGQWYEFSLITGQEWFGFDFKNKKLTYYDDGEFKINVSTWEQCGRAVAALIDLPELPQDANDQQPTISTWRDKAFYFSSFLVSQKDMFESWKRVSGDRDEDWTIGYQPSEERWKEGQARLAAGERLGFAQAMYARVFFKSGEGAYETKYGTANKALGLPVEDLDTCTRNAKAMMDSGFNYMAR